MSDQDVLFRAWHTQEKKMLFFSLWGLLAEYGDEGNYCSIVDTDLFRYGRDTSNLKIMQYIGRKDKNSKKVYKGDIIKATLVETGELKQVVEKVSYIEQYAGYAPFNHLMPFDEGRWIDCLSDGFEVIGNIYENPDLVK